MSLPNPIKAPVISEISKEKNIPAFPLNELQAPSPLKPPVIIKSITLHSTQKISVPINWECSKFTFTGFDFPKKKNPLFSIIRKIIPTSH